MSQKDSPPPPFVLAHISDLHLGPLPQFSRYKLLSKRILGYINWHRNRHRVRQTGWLETLVDDLRRQKADHIAVTGDLINLGLEAEMEEAAKWLAALGDQHDVTVVPGNHDAYVPGASKRALRLWNAFMVGDQTGHVATEAYPFVRRRGPVAIIGTNSAVATGPFMATGRFDRAQGRRLEAALAAAGQEGLFRTVLIHHPPFKGARWHRRLIGADHFREAIRRAGAELVLHGHDHHASLHWIDGPDGPVPVVGATSASQAPHGKKSAGSYGLFTIEKSGTDFTCTQTEFAPSTAGGRIEKIAETPLHPRA